jgi:hypothetical protein
MDELCCNHLSPVKLLLILKNTKKPPSKYVIVFLLRLEYTNHHAGGFKGQLSIILQ